MNARGNMATSTSNNNDAEYPIGIILTEKKITIAILINPEERLILLAFFRDPRSIVATTVGL